MVYKSSKVIEKVKHPMEVDNDDSPEMLDV